MTEKLNTKITSNVLKLKSFLKKQGLNYDNKIDLCLVIKENNEIIATASKYKNVFKMIAVDINYQSNNYVATLISELINISYQEEYYHYFIFTKKIYSYIFETLGFKMISSYKEIALFEKGNISFINYLDNIKYKIRKEFENIGSIVMNANPFTYGHKHLVDTALKKVDYLIVFVIEEDNSYFSFKTRFEIVQHALSNYNNVLVVKSGPYIISNATFPTYFLKENSDVNEYYTNIDINLYIKIMQYLNINYRFVGSEPIDIVTNYYNNQLKIALKEKLVIIDRVKINNNIVSASLVRQYLKDNKYKLIKDMVPDETYDILKKVIDDE